MTALIILSLAAVLWLTVQLFRALPQALHTEFPDTGGPQ